MREEFEKLPEIEKHLVFIDDFYNNKYHSMNNSSVTDFINGAWYAYQERQKKIDAIKKMIVSLRGEFDLWSDDTESFDAIEAQIENLEELLK